MQAVPYTLLFEELAIAADNVRELEDLVIETIYAVSREKAKGGLVVVVVLY